ncbi:pyridine nucleotide-disulfide oxidoreductase [Leucobacter luti]|uniref:Ferredoxin--NADP+ reductase n=1 Tax=Leucobacter luti TaxID=340320 RepID=A0A4R6S6A8_9MICO|nr:pyridine nucleotide-disulfide oxidoreductase [Leucobacter luti]MCW2288972.1 ferredoxin--NADP+ reductase [Leucobacter luti]QYM75142.1 pyridine nucleotide-disulfide oxidoreductase [Leucobacter luti]TCK44878.1 ferredoxin--NADP+ reductase [Leucobacter luti]TDP95399.1 ferredoxin--NADP+ reductase [Leucobacter luti]
MSKMRLAIVGAGPAGIYAADLLLKAERDFEVEIDLFEQLPAPYGLVRYGVSPDHPRIKGIITALRDVLDSGQIRFFGNVRYGRDITLEDLKRHYNAVIFSTGAIRDAGLDIPGIDAASSYGAADFVSWFDGHPDVPRTWPLEAAEVGVIGNGNVALDISRMLIKHADDLLPTEIPDNVYAGLKENPIQDLHLFGRRGPKYVKFTPLELRELGEVRDVDMIVDERDFDQDDAYADEVLGKNKQITVITRIMNKWRDEQREREASGEHASRRLHMHFWSKPVEVVVEDGRVAGLKIERTAPDGQGGVIDTGEFEIIPMQALYRAVGYFGSPVDEIPFDDAKGVIPNTQGRVQDLAGHQIPGVYATGWIKRGPIGLIGHTKSDAMETLECLIEDRATWWTPETAETDAIPALLHERQVPYTTIEGWRRLDEHELALGEEAGRTRIKVVPRDEMTRVSRGE